MRENSYAPFVDADNLSFHSEQRTEIVRLENSQIYPWRCLLRNDEVIFDFMNIDFLNNSEQVQLIMTIKTFLLEEKRIKFINLKSGIVPDFLYWIQ